MVMSMIYVWICVIGMSVICVHARILTTTVSNLTFKRTYIPNHGKANDTGRSISSHILANQTTLNENYEIIVFGNGLLSNETTVPHHDKKLPMTFISYVSVMVSLLGMAGVVILVKLMQKYKRKACHQQHGQTTYNP